ncbi:hypothetical protein ACFLZG_07230 [Thermodesulfobacteriota bacterium]
MDIGESTHPDVKRSYRTAKRGERGTFDFDNFCKSDWGLPLTLDVFQTEKELKQQNKRTSEISKMWAFGYLLEITAPPKPVIRE